MICFDDKKIKIDNYLNNFFTKKIYFTNQGSFLFLNDFYTNFMFLKKKVDFDFILKLKKIMKFLKINKKMKNLKKKKNIF